MPMPRMNLEPQVRAIGPELKSAEAFSGSGESASAPLYLLIRTLAEERNKRPNGRLLPGLVRLVQSRANLDPAGRPTALSR